MQAFARQFRHTGKYHSACPIQLRLVCRVVGLTCR
jgi:hypothetical protein